MEKLVCQADSRFYYPLCNEAQSENEAISLVCLVKVQCIKTRRGAISRKENRHKYIARKLYSHHNNNEEALKIANNDLHKLQIRSSVFESMRIIHYD